MLSKKTQALMTGVINGERSALARAVSLVESSRKEHYDQAQCLLAACLSLSHTTAPAPVYRISFSGPPGAGKSTFIEAFGSALTSRGKRVAVLAVDPSSTRTGGSILGDKTRMTTLSKDPLAFVRPSPSRGALGGVTRSTSDAILLCEMAGFDYVLVETVGVGQSETTVADMVDLFVLVLPPGGGDELQGIKRGVIEVSDLILVNKSDGDLMPAARRMQSELTSALKFVRPRHQSWTTPVLAVSSTQKTGMDQMMETTHQFFTTLRASGELSKMRREQHVKMMWRHIEDNLMKRFLSSQHVGPDLDQVLNDVKQQRLTPGRAADQLLARFFAK